MQSTNVPSIWRPRSSGAQGVPVERLRRPLHTPEQVMFLRRFHDLLEKRAAYGERYPETDWRRRLIDKALYSTYCDCLELELGDEVRELLRAGHEVPTG